MNAASKIFWAAMVFGGMLAAVQVVRSMPDVQKLIDQAVISKKDECGKKDKKACEWLETLEWRQKGCDAGEKDACRFLEAVKRGEASKG